MTQIALVEDEAIVALDIERTLVRRGYSVCASFDSGEDLLREIPSCRPDLIVMDVQIRGPVDGLDASAIVRERYGIPVILLTAYADSDTIARSSAAGLYAYLVKPFDEQELVAAVETALYRCRIEARLRESEARYRSLFEEGLSANFIASESGAITIFNKAFSSLLGPRAGDGETSITDFLSDPGDWNRILRSIADSGDFPQTEIGVRHSDGSLKSVLARFVTSPTGDRLIPPDSSRPREIRGEFVDLTERKRLEESLVQAQKLEVVGRLVGGIAHDFNNILTAIIGYADMAVLGNSCGPAVADIGEIRSTALKAANLTRQLLSFSRKQPHRPVAFDIQRMLHESERMLARVVASGIGITIVPASCTAHVYADPRQIELVVLNLVVNARDAMPEGGTITIRVRNATVFPGMVFRRNRTLLPGGYVVLEVEDSGTGIPAEIADRIFEPFFSTKREGRGTGLGLSIVDEILARNGGTIVLEVPGRTGTVFSVWLPSADEVERHRDPESGTERPAEAPPLFAGRPGRILLVEDDEDVLDVESRILAKAGHAVVTARNAGEALLLFESDSAGFDLAVIDIGLPRISGVRLADRLRCVDASLPVLFISGQPDQHPDTDQDGGCAFLAKPFTAESLGRAVHEILGARAACRQVPPTGPLPDRALPVDR